MVLSQSSSSACVTRGGLPVVPAVDRQRSQGADGLLVTGRGGADDAYAPGSRTPDAYPSRTLAKSWTTSVWTACPSTSSIGWPTSWARSPAVSRMTHPDHPPASGRPREPQLVRRLDERHAIRWLVRPGGRPFTRGPSRTADPVRRLPLETRPAPSAAALPPKPRHGGHHQRVRSQTASAPPRLKGSGTPAGRLSPEPQERRPDGGSARQKISGSDAERAPAPGRNPPSSQTHAVRREGADPVSASETGAPEVLTRRDGRP